MHQPRPRPQAQQPSSPPGLRGRVPRPGRSTPPTILLLVQQPQPPSPAAPGSTAIEDLDGFELPDDEDLRLAHLLSPGGAQQLARSRPAVPAELPGPESSHRPQLPVLPAQSAQHTSRQPDQSRSVLYARTPWCLRFTVPRHADETAAYQHARVRLQERLPAPSHQPCDAQPERPLHIVLRSGSDAPASRAPLQQPQQDEHNLPRPGPASPRTFPGCPEPFTFPDQQAARPSAHRSPYAPPVRGDPCLHSTGPSALPHPGHLLGRRRPPGTRSVRPMLASASRGLPAFVRSP